MGKTDLKRTITLLLHLICIAILLCMMFEQADPLWDKSFACLLVFVSLNFLKQSQSPN